MADQAKSNMIVLFSDESERNVGAMQKKNCYIIMNEKKINFNRSCRSFFNFFFVQFSLYINYTITVLTAFESSF